MINSPRSLEACKRVGVEPSELYQLTEEQFRQKYPEVISLNEKVFQYRYEAEEKIRKETIAKVMKEKEKIKEEKENKRKKRETKKR